MCFYFDEANDFFVEHCRHNNILFLFKLRKRNWLFLIISLRLWLFFVVIFCPLWYSNQPLFSHNSLIYVRKIIFYFKSAVLTLSNKPLIRSNNQTNKKWRHIIKKMSQPVPVSPADVDQLNICGILLKS